MCQTLEGVPARHDAMFPVFSVCVRMQTFGVLRGCLRTLGPRLAFGAVNLAEKPSPGNGLMRTQVQRVASCCGHFK
jgi:hypothetical protein